MTPWWRSRARIIRVWWAWAGETDGGRRAGRWIGGVADRGPGGAGVETGGGAEQPGRDERAQPVAVSAWAGRPAAGHPDRGRAGPGRGTPGGCGTGRCPFHRGRG